MMNVFPKRMMTSGADLNELEKLEEYLRDKGFRYKRTESLPTRLRVYDDAGNLLWRADLNMDLDFGGIPDELYGTLEVNGFLTPDEGVNSEGMTCEDVIRILEENGVTPEKEKEEIDAMDDDESREEIEAELSHDEVIDLCRAQGNLFATSFRSVVRPECSSAGFHAGCQTMQRAFEKVRHLRDGSKRPIRSEKLDRWFFAAGRTGPHAVDESYRETYEQLCEHLIVYRDTAQVEQILTELVIEPRRKREQVRCQMGLMRIIENQKDNHDYVMLIIKVALCKDKRDSLIPELASFFYHSGYRDRKQFEDTEETIYTLSRYENDYEEDADLNESHIVGRKDLIWKYASEIEAWADSDGFEQHKCSIDELEKDLRSIVNDLCHQEDLHKILTDNISFAIVSPYCGGKAEKENRIRMNRLKGRVRNDLKLGFVQFVSRWVEDGISYHEESLLIPNISFEDAMGLGRAFGRSSIIYKDGLSCREVCVNAFDSYQPNDVIKTFDLNGDHVIDIKDAAKVFVKRKDLPACFELFEVEEPKPSYFQTERKLIRII